MALNAECLALEHGSPLVPQLLLEELVPVAEYQRSEQGCGRRGGGGELGGWEVGVAACPRSLGCLPRGIRDLDDLSQIM